MGTPRGPLAGLLAGAALLAGGCTDSGPATVRVFGFDPATQSYGLSDRKLTTLADVETLRGSVVEMRGGATLVLDALAAVSDPKDPKSLRAEGGEAVRGQFTRDGDVLVPADFDTLAMASAYAALERAKETFVGLGIKAEELNPLEAYFQPDIQALTKSIPTFWFMTDNAAYAPPFDGFLIVPHLFLDGVPFFTNLGVMTHEYGHKVHNHLVERDARVVSSTANDWSVAATQHMRGVDEGLADVFGGIATGQSDFFTASIPDGAGIKVDRDMAKLRVMVADDVTAVMGSETVTYDPHEFGAFVASTLWAFGERIGDRKRVGTLVLEAERLEGELVAATPKLEYSVNHLWNAMLSKATPAERTELCALVRERFALLLAADKRVDLECP